MKDEIINIAKECRKWSEEYVLTHQDDFDEDLGCFCAIGASYLSEKLKAFGLENEIAVFTSTAMSHCFVVTEKYIVDITATQFNSPFVRKANKDKNLQPVEVRSKDKVNHRFFDFWAISKTFPNYQALLDYQKKSHWPKEQRIDGHPTIFKSFKN